MNRLLFSALAVAAFVLGAVFGAPVFSFLAPGVATSLAPAPQPCYAAASAPNTQLVGAYMRWATMMAETDPGFIPPDIDLITTAAGSQEWVLPDCYAVEQPNGGVVFYQRPLGDHRPFFTPHAG